jgi:hypothetical protein
MGRQDHVADNIAVGYGDGVHGTVRVGNTATTTRLLSFMVVLVGGDMPHNPGNRGVLR